MKRVVWALAGLLVGCTGKYVRPTTSETVQATPERLARGQYLVDVVAGCGECHTQRDSGYAFDNESAAPGSYLAGGNILHDAQVTLWIPNITSDVTTGVGAWTDDQLMRAIRDGVRPDGSFLHPVMPSLEYGHISDEDVRAIVAYLRSVPKVHQTRKPIHDDVPFFQSIGLGMGFGRHAPAQDVPPPPKNDPVKRGEYLAHVAHCPLCHSLGKFGPRASDDDYMAGSTISFETPFVVKVWAPNLTPDQKTGLGAYSLAQIARALRTGKRLEDGQPMAYPMSALIPHISGLTEQDMGDLLQWLASLKPVSHAVPPRELSPEGQRRYTTR